MKKTSLNSHKQQGFTLIELLIVVAIIGILAAVAIPLMTRYKQSALAASTAADLKNFRTAFESYAAENGGYPNDSHIVLPPGTGLEQIINDSIWLATTPVGGNYNWEGPDAYPYAGVAILGATAALSTLRMVDKSLDDGDLTTGVFRQTPNGRYTYIFEE